MNCIRTYQDYKSAQDKERFLLNAIDDYKSGEFYKRAVEANLYYLRQNPAIMERRAKIITIEKPDGKSFSVKRNFNRKCCGFLALSINQIVSYLLGNGITSLNETQKKALGPNFYQALFKIGKYAQIDGVGWGYYSKNVKGNITTGNVQPFRATEYFGLPDEKTGLYDKLGIRFYQIAPDKPLYITKFELDGMYEYKSKGNNSIEFLQKVPYRYRIKKDAIENIQEDLGYDRIPVIPFWRDDTRASALTDGLKFDIDLYDRIMSDFGDNLDRANDFLYIFQNYSGGDAEEMVAQIEAYNSIFAETDMNSSIEVKSFEVPYKARETALSMLEAQMYKETSSIDYSQLTNGDLRNVGIKAALGNFEQKADDFETEANAFVSTALDIAGVPYEEDDIVFERRTLLNDSETIADIDKMIAGKQYISKRAALDFNPKTSNLSKERKLEILAEIDTETMQNLNERFPFQGAEV